MRYWFDGERAYESEEPVPLPLHLAGNWLLGAAVEKALENLARGVFPDTDFDALPRIEHVNCRCILGQETL